MVAIPPSAGDPTRRSREDGPSDALEASQSAKTPHDRRRRRHYRRAPLLWRFLLSLDRRVIRLTGRLEVTGDIPDDLIGTPVLLAANHVGNLDPLVVMAACYERRIPVRFLATGGLFDAPVLGWVMKRARHVRVDRHGDTASEAVADVGRALREHALPVLVYPEGRISLEPDLWPERGKTGVARMALAAGTPVIPVSQWGAHEGMCYGKRRVHGPLDLAHMFFSWVRAIFRRPTFKVHFGAPVDLSGLSAERVGDASRARDRIMRAITRGLLPLRADELATLRHRDRTRPATMDKPSPYRPDQP